MQASAEDIERIVQVVLERLRSAAPKAEDRTHMPSVPNASPLAGSLVLREPVISIGTLKGQLSGIARLVVPLRAVVTPAVTDLLRKEKIELVRSNSGTPVSAAGPTSSTCDASLLVCGSAAWLQSLIKQFDAQQIKIEQGSDQQALGILSKHFTAIGARALWLADRPYAASHQAAVLGRTVAHLHVPQDIDAAFEQVGPDLLVVNGRSWSVAAVVNLLRCWLRRS